MSYRLKANAPEFTVVDGSMAGRTFRHGIGYDTIPESDQSRFEAVADVPAVSGRKRKKDQPEGLTDALPGKNDEETRS